MQTYAEFRPKSYDPNNTALPDKQNWLVLPLALNRFSKEDARDNFVRAIDLLEDDSNGYCTHRFASTTPAWLEIILVRPGTTAQFIAEEIADYINEGIGVDDSSIREMMDECYCESWDMGDWREFAERLIAKFDLTGKDADILLDDDFRWDLRELYAELTDWRPYRRVGADTIDLKIPEAVAHATMKHIREYIDGVDDSEE